MTATRDTASMPAPLPAFLSEVEVSLADADQVIDRVLRHLSEHEFAVTRHDDGGIVTFHAGETRVQHRPDGLLMRATLQLDKKNVLVNTYWRRGMAESG